MTIKFNPGDVVCLRSGGPNMLVIASQLPAVENHVLCVWVNLDDTIRQGFAPDQLMLLIPKQRG